LGVAAASLTARRGPFVLEVPAFAADDGGTAVLGPNGAGKTTLLLALQGLIASNGHVERPPRCAAVFARPAVMRGSALWNVATIVQATRALPSAEAVACAHDALRDVGLSEVAGADARTLSTGERQRLALARALAVEPKALFLDEPFANVDADARPALRTLVRSYVERTRCDLVVATSSLADAAALCRVALVLQRGKVVHRGPIRQLSGAHDPFVRALYAESSAGSERG
jgi:ABC-type multidrug transport system ATPase subunit